MQNICVLCLGGGPGGGGAFLPANPNPTRALKCKPSALIWSLGLIRNSRVKGQVQLHMKRIKVHVVAEFFEQLS